MSNNLIEATNFITSTFHCDCQNMVTTEHNHLLEEFSILRSKCSAIKEVLIPEDDWPAFQRVFLEKRDQAVHCSILLLAFERGHISKITSPIHRYLMEGKKPKLSLTKQYAKDLIEYWLLEETEIERHRKSKMFIGKLIELQCTEWIEDQGWKIFNISALGGNADIEAQSPEHIECAIEIKYIGQIDEDFLAVVETLSGKTKPLTLSPYASSDYILFRVYEAAKQLQVCIKTRIVFLLISEIAWPVLGKVLRDNWMLWQSPRFYNSDPDWKIFFQEQKKAYPDIEKELQCVISSIAVLWIIKTREGFQFSQEYVSNLRKI